MTVHPWDWAQATQTAHKASVNQRANQDAIRAAYGLLADRERDYRKALADKIRELRGEGVAATVASDLARGDAQIADLRHDRDEAAGVVKAAEEAGWAAAADRRDVASFIDWSKRAAFRDDHGDPTGSEPVHGLRPVA